MLRRFARLAPYLKANRRMLYLGAAALIAANYFDIRVLVLIGEAIDVVAREGAESGAARTDALVFILGVILLFAIAGAAARFWMRWLIIGVSREIEFSLRNDLFAHLQKLSPSFFAKYPTGDLMARSSSDVESIRMLIGPAVMYISSTAVMLPMSLYQMIRISGQLTLMTWLPMLGLAPLFFFFSTRIHKRFLRSQELFSSLSARVQEHLSGIRVVKSYAAEQTETARFAEVSRQYAEENIGLAKLQAFFIPLMGFFIGLSMLGLVWGGGWMVARGAAGGAGITEGKLIAFFVLLMANIWPLAAVGWVFSMMERGAVSMKRLDEILEAKPEVVDAVGAAPTAAEDIKGGIEFRHLTFAFPGAEAPALRDIDLRVPAGTVLGLTGPVGCGKSAIAHLLARRFNPPRGQLLIDGKDALDWPLALYRSRVAIVDQEPFVFSETVGENVAYGLPESRREETARVVRIAQLEKDLPNLPNGIETMLGERGINLSGGQRQRAALARALAVDPAILILDDALSAVDTHTEEEILRGLEEFMRGRTTILITHRIRAVSVADHILYLEHGRIAEQGTHEELMARGGHYAGLARRQQLAEEIEATA